MTANSFNGAINTNGNWVTVESVTVGVTGSTFTGFTAGYIYNIWAGNQAQFKVGDYIVPVLNEKFDYKPNADDDIYIKTNYTSCQLSILENIPES